MEPLFLHTLCVVHPMTGEKAVTAHAETDLLISMGGGFFAPFFGLCHPRQEEEARNQLAAAKQTKLWRLLMD